MLAKCKTVQDFTVVVPNVSGFNIPSQPPKIFLSKERFPLLINLRQFHAVILSSRLPEWALYVMKSKLVIENQKKPYHQLTGYCNKRGCGSIAGYICIQNKPCSPSKNRLLFFLFLLFLFEYDLLAAKIALALCRDTGLFGGIATTNSALRHTCSPPFR